MKTSPEGPYCVSGLAEDSVTALTLKEEEHTEAEGLQGHQREDQPTRRSGNPAV